MGKTLFNLLLFTVVGPHPPFCQKLSTPYWFKCLQYKSVYTIVVTFCQVSKVILTPVPSPITKWQKKTKNKQKQNNNKKKTGCLLPTCPTIYFKYVLGINDHHSSSKRRKHCSWKSGKCCGEHSISMGLVWNISMSVLMKLKGHSPYPALAITVEVCKILYLSCITTLGFNLRFNYFHGWISSPAVVRYAL